jgi:hypothetical protein
LQQQIAVMNRRNLIITYDLLKFVRMAKQKLTLALDPELISFGKNYATQRNTTITEVFERYLAALRDTELPKTDDPLVASVRAAALQREPITMDALHELREQSLLDQMLRYETGS